MSRHCRSNRKWRELALTKYKQNHSYMQSSQPNLLHSGFKNTNTEISYEHTNKTRKILGPNPAHTDKTKHISEHGTTQGEGEWNQNSWQDVRREDKTQSATWCIVVIRLDVTRDLPCCPQSASQIILELPLHSLTNGTTMHEVSLHYMLGTAALSHAWTGEACMIMSETGWMHNISSLSVSLPTETC